MLGDDVAFAGVAGQGELVRRREVSARELVELTFSRIDRLDPKLNTFGAVYPKRALRERRRRPTLTGTTRGWTDKLGALAELLTTKGGNGND